MKKYFHFPEGFDTIQFTKVMVKACDRAYDLKMFYTLNDERCANAYRDMYLKDNSALDFACELLDYDVKSIYDTIRIIMRLGKTYDEAEIYCKLIGIGYYF